MALRIPSLGWGHAAQNATVTAIPAADPVYPETALYDGRSGVLFKFGSAVDDAEVRIQRTTSEPLNILYIPAGHNLTLGTGAIWWEDSDDGSAWDLVDVIAFPTEDVPVVFTTATPSTRAYQRIRFQEATPVAWELGELVWASSGEVPLGPAYAWQRGSVPAETISALSGGGTAAWRLGSPRLGYTLTFSAQEDVGLEFQWNMLDEIGWGRGTPFLIEPPDDRDPWLWVTLAALTRLPVQDFPNPSAFGPTYTFRYDLIENR
jgi:hypothetical protein